MRPPDPIQTIDVLPAERARLLNLLSQLSDQEWETPTACAGWSVKDVALHLWGNDLGRLSRGRDGFSGAAPEEGESLVAFINRLNESWVRATRRLSPRVLRDHLRLSGEQTFAFFASLDPTALGEPVSWAGPEPAPTWLDLAREYTERWHHQQHIRNTVGAAGLTERRFLAPVLATFVHALPHTFRAVVAPPGTAVHLHIDGESGGDWSVARERGGWVLYSGAPAEPAARLTIDQTIAWRVFTKGLSPADAERQATLEGDRRLARRVLEAVAIIA